MLNRSDMNEYRSDPKIFNQKINSISTIIFT